MRRYDIDALRVIVFGLLIFYHLGMFFVPWDFHLKNSVTYDWLKYPMIFLNRWRLPLLFVISGIGTFFNITKRNGWNFVGERFMRLFIPLVVGMLLIVPPQVYFERLDAGQFYGNYFEFWISSAFSGGAYPEGNISWHHLWFLPYLLLYSIVLTPVFIYLRNHPQTWIIRKTKRLISCKFGLLLLVIPLMFWEIFLRPRFPSTHGLLDDWYNHVNYGTLFFYGFLLMTVKDTLWENITKHRRMYLICGVIIYILMTYIEFVAGYTPHKYTPNTLLFHLLWATFEWTWILVIISYAVVYLNKPSRKLSYTTEAVYPFYILHQSVIIALGFYLKNVEMCLFAKFSVMVIGTFGITWLIYEIGIRRHAWIRPLFGMKRIKDYE